MAPVAEHRDPGDLATPDPAPTNNAPQKPKGKGSPVVGAIVLVVIVAAIVNAGNDDDPAPSTGTTPVVTEVPAAVDEPQAALPEDGAGLADNAVVPDVVGLNHQLAHDTLRASGFCLLDALRPQLGRCLPVRARRDERVHGRRDHAVVQEDRRVAQGRR
jgi:hypothetical protein